MPAITHGFNYLAHPYSLFHASQGISSQVNYLLAKFFRIGML